MNAGCYQDYSGAFCALVMLRAYVDDTTKALRSHQWEKARHGLTQSRFWIGEFVARRESARRHHGYKAPLPDVLTPEEWKLVLKTGRCR